MTLKIYNTFGKKKETFEPLEPGKVKMYVCGPTVYDSCHIGHARSLVVFDVIARYLRKTGYEVTYIRNFTDVDDKIINRANEKKLSYTAVAQKYIDEFYKDMDAIYVERASVEPRATQHIDQIIGIVGNLIDKNMAYEVDGDVFFAIDKFKNYGRLSGRRLDDMEAGSRVEIDKRKRNPFDFALWKKAKEGEPFWESPWGQGRPGWHIECSAMSSHYLGETFDIHGGGKDLIFPHHENEIAQSEGAFDKPFARYWIHNGFVNINHEKMSKSLGNFLMIKDIIKAYHSEALRLFLLSSHYRSPIDYTEAAIKEVGLALDKVYGLLLRFEESFDIRLDSKPYDRNQASVVWQSFCEAMDDDFNTAKGIGILFETVRTINRLMDEYDGQDESEAKKIQTGIEEVKAMGSVLGILNENAADYFENKRQKGIQKDSIDTRQIEELIEKRTLARKNKDWAAADQIRDQLSGMGIVIEDKPGQTVWKVKE